MRKEGFGLEEMTSNRIYEELEKEDACEIEVMGIRRMKLKEASPFVHKVLQILYSCRVLGDSFLSELEGNG